MTHHGTTIVIAEATAADREAIYRIRHAVYAVELNQHSVNEDGMLSDDLDTVNVYLVARKCGAVVGFISVTPPAAGRYSIDKYVERSRLPFDCDDGLFEVRLLTVPVAHRARQMIASALLYASLRYVEDRGGTRIVAIGREEVLGMYRRAGLGVHDDFCLQSGEVCFRLVSRLVSDLREHADTRLAGQLLRMDRSLQWDLTAPIWRQATNASEASPTLDKTCYHGGAFWDGIGADFRSLHRRNDIVPADVLNAWFPPAPSVIAALTDELPWLLRTSPPTNCDGLIAAIARARGIPEASIAVGSGSSDLIYRALREWLTVDSRVLLLDPTYGEYAHVLENVIGCRVERFRLPRDDDYRLDLDALVAAALAGHYDLIVLVNPNNPTGGFVPRRQLKDALLQIPISTRVWVDEAYLDYIDPAESLEPFAAESENVVVCKSLSKVYALSGARAAYVVCSEATARELRRLTPPWVIGLPAQVAAVRALDSPEYYAARYSETGMLRAALCERLQRVLPRGTVLKPSPANWILCYLPQDSPDAGSLVTACRLQSVYLRDAASQGMGARVLRIAVRDEADNDRIVAVLASVLRGLVCDRPSTA